MHVNLRSLAILLNLAALATVASSTARADDSQKTCTDAYELAQTLRDAHKLKSAREPLRVCAQSTCAAFIVKECTAWLVHVEGRVPGVVFSAQDTRGQALTDVTISMDGTPIARRIDGQSIEVDPGPHQVTFVASDGTKVEQSVVVLEGQKTQVVAATIPTSASKAVTPPAPEPVTPPVASPPPMEPPAQAPPPAAGYWTGRRLLGITAAGAGVVGLVVGGAFGAMTLSAASQQKSDCATPTNCPNHADALAQHSNAQTYGTVSEVGLIAGGVLVAGGGVVFFTGGSSEASPRRTGLWVVPEMGSQGGGVAVGGRF